MASWASAAEMISRSCEPVSRVYPPQAAVLAVGRIKPRPYVDRGVLVPAATMQLCMSIDHRVLDGAGGARFLADLAALIEAPGLLLDHRC